MFFLMKSFCATKYESYEEEMLLLVVLRVFSFITLTEELLHEISLVEVVGCTLNICFLGYYCMMVHINLT